MCFPKTVLYLINKRVRKLSPRECARLQGFPDSFIIDDSPSQAYKQFGNSLAIDVVQKILIEVKPQTYSSLIAVCCLKAPYKYS